MANRKITDLNALTAPAAADVLPIVDISESSNALKNKKITVEDLLSNAPTGSVAAPSFAFASDTDTGMYRAAANHISFVTAGVNRVRIAGDGKVGIGSTSPDARLDVSRLGAAWAGAAPIAGTTIFAHSGGTGTNSPSYIQISSGTSANAGIHFGDSDDADAGRILYGNSDDHMRFHAGNNERIRILSDGKVGIGTSTPTNKFTVKDGNHEVFNVDQDTFVVSQNNSTWSNLSYDRMPVLGWEYKTGPGDLFYMGCGGNNSTANQMALVVSRNHGLKFGKTGYDGSKLDVASGADEYFRITTDGKVGIGTSAPSMRLVVKNDDPTVSIVKDGAGELRLKAATDSSGHMIRFGGSTGGGASPTVLRFVSSGDSERARFTGTGEFLINTTTGGSRLKVVGKSESSAIAAHIVAGNAASTVGLIVDGDNETGDVLIRARSNSESTPTDADTKFVVLGNGNVGVGLQTPSYKFDVIGAVAARASDNATGGFISSSGSLELWRTGSDAFIDFKTTTSEDYDCRIQQQSNGLAFRTGGNGSATEKVRITSGGSVGIGTTGPARELHIQSSNPGIRITDSDSSSDHFDVRNVNGDGLLQATGDKHIKLYTNGNERVRIQNNGRLAVGATSADGIAHFQDSSPVIAIKSDGDNTAARHNVLRFIYNGGGVGSEIVASRPSGGDSSDVSLDIRTGGGNAASNKVRIQANGNVGIGTTAPAALLHINKSAGNYIKLSTGGSVADTQQGLLHYGRFVSGTTPAFPGQLTSFIKEVRNGSNAAFSLQFGTVNSTSADASTKMMLRYDGRVGIGTTSPSQALHVVGNVRASSGVYVGGTQSYLYENANNSVSLRVGGDGPYFRFKDLGSNLMEVGNASGSISLITSGSERVRFTGDGKVGIGTSSPSQKLHVQGTSLLKGEVIVAATGTNGEGGQITLKNPNGTDTGGTMDISSANVHRIFSVADDYLLQMGQLGGTGGKIQLHTAGSERMRITADGKIAIGTTNPGGQVHVESASGAGWQIRTDTVNLNNESGFYRNASNHYQVVIRNGGGGNSFIENSGTSTSPNLRFQIGSNERMRLDTGGRLLIGRTVYQSAGDPHSPGKLVYVENEGTAGYQVLVGITNRNDAHGPTIVLGKTRGTAVGSNTIVQAGDSLGAIRWVGADGNDRQPKAAEIQAAVDGTPGTNDMPGRLVFRTTSDGNETPSDRMVIKSDGKVGIGTSSPDTNFHLKGTSFTTLRIEATSNDPAVALKTSAGEWTIRNDQSNSDMLTYRYDNNFRFGCTTDGKIGFGTSSPEAKLHLKGSGSAGGGIYLEDSSTSGSAPSLEIIGKRSDSNNSLSFGGKVLLAKNRTDSRIDSGNKLGAVLFGGNHTDATIANVVYAASIYGVAQGNFDSATSMPTSIAFGTGDVGRQPYSANVDYGSERMRLTYQGRLGIGLTAPGAPLHVKGTRDYTGSTPNQNSYDCNIHSGTAYLSLGQSNGVPAIQGHGTGTSYNLALAPNAGNVAIGHTTPQAKLAVFNGSLGTSDGNTKNHFSFHSNTANPDYIKLDHIRDGAGNSWTTAKQKLYRKVDSTVMGFIQFGSHGTGGDLVTIGEGSNEYMRVDGSGKVSIGQTTSQAKLSVRMTAAFDSTNAVGTAAIFARNAGTAGAGNLGGAITLSKINSTRPGGSIVAVQTSSDADHMGLAFFVHTSGSTSDTVVEKMRLKHDGTLGLGTTSPGALMHLRKVNAEANLDLEDSEGFRMRHFTRYDGASERYWGLYNHTDARTVLRYKRTTSGAAGDVMCMLENGGSVVIGKNGQFDTSSEAALQITGAADDLGAAISMMRRDATISSGSNMARIKVFSDEGSPTLSADVQFAASQAHTSTAKGSRIKFHVTPNNTATPAERIRIDQQGQTTFHSTGIAALFKTSGTQTTGSAIQINTGASAITSTGTTVFKVFRDGDVANTNNTYGGLSDSKLKENVADASSQWEDLKAVQVRNYNYKADTGYGTHTQIGVVAQEIETVSPGLVTDVPDVDDDGNDLGTTTKSVKYSVLYMKAIKALQEAIDRIETLEAKVAALEAE